MLDLYGKTIQFVDKSFGKTRDHYVRAVYWLLQLKPDADEVLKIATYAHDIERAFQDFDGNGEKIANSPAGFMEDTMMAHHQERGGVIMRDFLLENGASEALANKVNHLISKHEVGGDDQQNLLKDADSISFLECNAELFTNKLVGIFGYQKCKDKLDFMYNRISSNEAKEIARPMYENLILTLTCNQI